MRYNKAYRRVLLMLHAPEVPRRADGQIRLCPACQRRIYFAGGFLALLSRNLETSARHGHEHPYLGRR